MSCNHPIISIITLRKELEGTTLMNLVRIYNVMRNICLLCTFACVSCHLRRTLYMSAYVCLACSHTLPSCSCMLSSCFGILPLLSMVGVPPAHLGKKTSKLAWFSHSTDSQDGMCASLCGSDVRVPCVIKHVYINPLSACMFTFPKSKRFCVLLWVKLN